MGGKLYVVGTPIGNLGDISPRALDTLSIVDFIAAEDTRVTVKLLNHFDIKKPLVSYFEHNKLQKGDIIIDRILSGESCALVTDAGMPAISDPGEDLVRLARERGVEIESVPGPSALVTALAISGMPSGRFCFEGFLSVNKNDRKKHLEEIKNDTRTLIFYEAPHKLRGTLKDLYGALGERKIAIVKELTKIHETVNVATLSESLDFYSQNQPKGEFVLIIEGAAQNEAATVYSLSNATQMARNLIDGGTPPTVAAKEIATITGFKKGEIYKALIESRS